VRDIPGKGLLLFKVSESEKVYSYQGHFYNAKYRETIYKMSRITFTRRFAIVLLTSFLFCLFIPTSGFAQTSSQDEISIRLLIEKFFAAYEKRELNELLGLWSEKSPDLATNKKALEATFTATQKLEINALAIGKITVNGDKASLRLALEVNAIDAKTGKQAQGFGKLNRTLHLVKESGEWKIWQNLSNEEELAAALVEAKTDAEREQLLAADRELATVALVQALLTQGRRLIGQSKNGQAYVIYSIAGEIAYQLDDKKGSMAVLQGIANIGAARNYSLQALEYYKRTLKIAEEIGDKAGIGLALNSIGRIYQNKRNYAEALEYFHKGLPIVEEIGNKAEVSLTLARIGGIHYYQGNYTEALEYQQRSVQIVEEIGDKTRTGASLNLIGNIHRVQGNYTEALEHYQRSLKFAEEVGNKFGISSTTNNIANVLQLQGNYTQAIEFANRSADFAQQIGSPDTFWQSRFVAGQAYQALNQPDEAKKAFTEAIAWVEDARNQVGGNEQSRHRYFAERLAPYYGMMSLLMNQNNTTEAFALAERAKARVLLDVFQTGKSDITKAMSLAEKQQEQKFNSQIVSLNAQIYQEKLRPQQDQARLDKLNIQLEKARFEMEFFHSSIYAMHPELRPQRSQEAQTLSLSEAVALIPDDKTALLEFVVSEEQTYLFALSKSASQSAPDVKIFKIDIKQTELAKLCQEYRKQLADRRVSYQDLATKLYDLLLKSARSQLPDKTNLVIIPDGVLWELPFQTLQPARNHFLIEDAAISYAPSLTVLQKMMQTRQKRGTAPANTLLAIGNPIISTQTLAQVKTVFMDADLLPLPEAERQVKLLQKLYTPSHSKVYIGHRAYESKVKAEARNSRILQLATHSILNDANPMYSQIVLAHDEADPNQDGLLEAWEIMNLDLKADLVVLSACETARGKVGAGEGMIGLAWAFFVAGSPAIVVSQWKVESASTTQLMVAFHKNLQTPAGKQNPKMTKAEAMRRAALKLLKTPNYRHPFYWAAFVVIGDAS
jgi:CHAT domain-containing protein/tetratricopeptide (TPR) repeat protein